MIMTGTLVWRATSGIALTVRGFSITTRRVTSRWVKSRWIHKPNLRFTDSLLDLRFTARIVIKNCTVELQFIYLYRKFLFICIWISLLVVLFLLLTLHFVARFSWSTTYTWTAGHTSLTVDASLTVTVISDPIFYSILLSDSFLLSYPIVYFFLSLSHFPFFIAFSVSFFISFFYFLRVMFLLFL